MGDESSKPTKKIIENPNVVIAIISTLGIIVAALIAIIPACVDRGISTLEPDEVIESTPLDTPIPTNTPVSTNTQTSIPIDTPMPTSTPALPVIAFLTAQGDYVTAGNDGTVKGQASTIEEWEKFWVNCLEDGRVAFLTHHGTYITALGGDYNWILEAKTTALDDFEKFTIVDPTSPVNSDNNTYETLGCQDFIRLLDAHTKNQIALETNHGRFITAMGHFGSWDGELRADTTQLQASEIFPVTLLSP